MCVRVRARMCVCEREREGGRERVCVKEREGRRESGCVCCVVPLRIRLSMGWLRLVGSIKLQVFFAKEPYKRDEIPRKRPVI